MPWECIEHSVNAVETRRSQRRCTRERQRFEPSLLNCTQHLLYVRCCAALDSARRTVQAFVTCLRDARYPTPTMLRRDLSRLDMRARLETTSSSSAMLIGLPMCI
jgi:hypothetical protein